MRIVWIAFSLILFGCRSAVPPSQEFEWSSYGGDEGGSRFVPYAQINGSNVDRLKTAWTYHTGESEKDGAAWQKAAFEATPIFADGTLYFSTPFNRIIAINARSGTETWRFDPGVDLNKNYSEVTSRGVATWLDESVPVAGPCRRRIYAGTIDARLIAVDAATGRACADFGEGGMIDLSRGVERYRRGDYEVTSPPVVIDGMVIVGSSIGDKAQSRWNAVLSAPLTRDRGSFDGLDPLPAVLPGCGAARGPMNDWGAAPSRQAWALVGDPQRGRFVRPEFYVPNTTGGERTGRTNGRTPWSRFAPEMARASGTFRSSITTSGTTTSRRSRCCSCFAKTVN